MKKETRQKEERSQPREQTGISFGGLLEGLGKLMELVSEAAEKGQVSRQGTFRAPGKQTRGVYGFTIRNLAGSRPVIRRFGNFHETPKGAIVDEVSEPVVDVFEEGDRLRVVAELPGCEEKDVRAELKGGRLTISGDGGKRKYQGEVQLPGPVEEASLRSSYRNGVLEIELARKG